MAAHRTQRPACLSCCMKTHEKKIIWAQASVSKSQICLATAVEHIVLLSYLNTQDIQLNYQLLLIKAPALHTNKINNNKKHVNSLNGCNCNTDIPKIRLTIVYCA